MRLTKYPEKAICLMISVFHGVLLVCPLALRGARNNHKTQSREL